MKTVLLIHCYAAAAVAAAVYLNTTMLFNIIIDIFTASVSYCDVPVSPLSVAPQQQNYLTMVVSVQEVSLHL